MVFTPIAAGDSRPVPTTSTDIRAECHAGVLALTLDRPDRLNALTNDMVWALAEVIEAAADDADIRLITLTGAGRAFCAGADIARSGPDPVSLADLPGSTLIDAANRLALAMTSAPQLVVALVNGPAVGVGSSIALTADLAVASGSAYLKTGFETIGLMPDGGGTAFLSAALGRNRALALAVLGSRLTAENALDYGLVAAAWPDEEFREKAAAFVAHLAAGPSRAYTATKRAINDVTLDRLPTALEFERREQRRLLGSADFAEGIAAFNAKRRPDFRGV